MSGDKPFTPDRGRAASTEMSVVVPASSLDESRRRSRATATRPAPRYADKGGEQLSEGQIEAIRSRIADGVYDSREVAEEVARRLLESGDL